MNDDIKKIAQEAAIKFCNSYGGRRYRNELAQAIESACEKTSELWRERFRKFEKIEDKFGPASQRVAHTK